MTRLTGVCKSCGLIVTGAAEDEQEAKSRLGNNLRNHYASRRCRARRRYVKKTAPAIIHFVSKGGTEGESHVPNEDIALSMIESLRQNGATITHIEHKGSHHEQATE